MKTRLLQTCILTLLLFGCTTSPTGRSQIKIISAQQMDSMGAQSFAALKKESKIDPDKRHQAFARCVADALIPVLPPPYPSKDWEVVVFIDESPNAFALPGGKIGVNTGMIELVSGQDELAVVMAHELAHVVAEHGNERVSTQMATELGINLIASSAGTSNPDRTAALLGAGAQLGILLPFSRTQESEADELGLHYMAEAGFNPKASITLWKKMAEKSGKKVEFLQTHPNSENRIRQFEAWMPKAEVEYEAARNAGKKPDCYR